MQANRLYVVAALALTWFSGIGAAAQTYPTRPVRLLVPFVAGGSSDTIARVLGQPLTAMWGQQIVVDNRPGAGTIIGTEIAAKAPADGHTLITENIAFAINHGLRRNLPYDTFRDFAPIIMLARQPSAIVAPPNFPANSLKDLIALAKSKPGVTSYGSSGIGTIGHLAGELLKMMAGIKLTHVAYKGGGQLVTEVLGNQIPLGIMGLPPAMPHIKAGRLKAIALTDGKRAAALPDLPTVGETVPGFEVNNWIGLVAPAGTPVPVITKINADTLRVLQMPDVKNRLSALGFEIQGSSPREFETLVRADAEKFQRIIKDAGIKAN